MKGLAAILLYLCIVHCCNANEINLICRDLNRACQIAQIALNTDSKRVVVRTGGCATPSTTYFSNGNRRVASDGEVVQQFVTENGRHISFGERVIKGPILGVSMRGSVDGNTGIANLWGFTLQCHTTKKIF